MVWRPSFLGWSPHLPPALGPYVPGCADVMTSESKDGLFLRLYYPTDLDKSEDHSKKWISWLPDKNYLKGFAYVLGLWHFLFQLLYDVVAGDKKIPVAENAPISDKIGRLPVIVFSHGMGGTRFLYSCVCCEMAAHGYVVAAVEHKDGSASNTWYFSDKSKTDRKWLRYRRTPLGQTHMKIRSEQVEQRATEVSRALELLQDLGSGKTVENALGNEFSLDQLKDRLDLSSPIMMGQSFGGATTLLALAKYPAFRMGVIMDPWMFPIRLHDSLHEKVEQPLLCINMHYFQVPPNLKILHKFTSSPEPAIRCNYTIKQTTHENQSDSVHLIGYWLDFLMKKIDPITATRVNNALIIKFLKEHGGLKVETNVEICLKENENLIVSDICVEGASNKIKKIPGRTIILT